MDVKVECRLLDTQPRVACPSQPLVSVVLRDWYSDQIVALAPYNVAVERVECRSTTSTTERERTRWLDRTVHNLEQHPSVNARARDYADTTALKLKKRNAYFATRMVTGGHTFKV